MTDTATGATPDAIELLVNDHREVEQLFKRMEAARATGNTDEQRYATQHVVEDFSVHAVIEEEILYPVMRTRFQTVTSWSRRRCRSTRRRRSSSPASTARTQHRMTPGGPMTKTPDPGIAR